MQAQLQAEAAARVAARRLVVDGKEFAVRGALAGPARSTHYDRLSGPNRGHGFGGSGTDGLTGDAAVIRDVRILLGMVDPATGCIED